MQKLLKAFRILDYIVAAGTIGYGAWTLNVLIVALGISGLVLAKLNLSERLSAKLKKVLRRTPVTVVHLEDETPVTATPVPTPIAKAYTSQLLTVGLFGSNASRHNVMTSSTTAPSSKSSSWV